jgi:hypothetical protein
MGWHNWFCCLMQLVGIVMGTGWKLRTLPYLREIDSREIVDSCYSIDIL